MCTVCGAHWAQAVLSSVWKRPLEVGSGIVGCLYRVLALVLDTGASR